MAPFPSLGYATALIFLPSFIQNTNKIGLLTFAFIYVIPYPPITHGKLNTQPKLQG